MRKLKIFQKISKKKYNHKAFHFALIFIFLFSLCSGCVVKDDDKKIGFNDILIYNLPSRLEMLDPYRASSRSTLEVCDLFFNGLVKTDENLNLVPDLAVEVPSLENNGISEDGRIITYKLKENVFWHDGEPLTSADVKFTWELLTEKKGNYSVVRLQGYDLINRVETPDNRTIKFYLNEPYSPFIGRLFRYILPKHKLEKIDDVTNSTFWYSPVGSGPYKLKHWKLDESLFVEANVKYFQGKPEIRTIDIRFYSNSEIIEKILNKNIQIWTDYSQESTSETGKFPEFNKIKVLTGKWEAILFNLEDELISDKNIRKAFNYVLDRKSYVNNIFLGEDCLGIITAQFPKHWAFNGNLTPSSFNIEKANEILDIAGFTEWDEYGFRKRDGERFQVSLTYLGNEKNQAKWETLFGQFKEIGVQLQAKGDVKEDYYGSYEEGGAIPEGEYQLALVEYYTGHDPDNSYLWSNEFIPSDNNPSGTNFSRYNNPVVDELLRKAILTNDIDERQEYYFKIQEILKEDLPLIILHYKTRFDIVSKELKNYKPHPLGNNFWNVNQWKFIMN